MSDAPKKNDNPEGRPRLMVLTEFGENGDSALRIRVEMSKEIFETLTPGPTTDAELRDAVRALLDAVELRVGSTFFDEAVATAGPGEVMHHGV